VEEAMRLKITPPLVGAALALVVLGSIAVRRALSRPEPQTPTFKPFVLHERELNKSRDGTVTKEVDFTVARRADGSLMRSFVIQGADSPSGEDGKVVFIWDMATGTKITLEPFTKSVMTQHLSSAETEDFVSSQHACGEIQGQPSNGSRALSTMLGYSVIRTEESDDVERIVRWVAPDLDCYPLEKTTWFLEPRRGGDFQDTMVSKIEPGEPPSSSFELPRDYIERSPLQIESEFTAKFSGHPFFGNHIAQDAEKQYRRHQVSEGTVNP
jgi:hypothetical protein